MRTLFSLSCFDKNKFCGVLFFRKKKKKKSFRICFTILKIYNVHLLFQTRKIVWQTIVVRSPTVSSWFEPCHEIMVLFVHPKFILQTLAHAQPSSGTRCLIFGRTIRLLPYFVCANSEGSGETARVRRLAWAFAGRLCDKSHNLIGWLI